MGLGVDFKQCRGIHLTLPWVAFFKGRDKHCSSSVLFLSEPWLCYPVALSWHRDGSSLMQAMALSATSTPLQKGWNSLCGSASTLWRRSSSTLWALCPQTMHMVCCGLEAFMVCEESTPVESEGWQKSPSEGVVSLQVACSFQVYSKRVTQLCTYIHSF